MEEKKTYLIAPSLLSADFSRMEDGVRLIERAGGDWLHFDVMDGMFVPDITFGHKMLSDLRPRSRLPFDVHLMIREPERHIARFLEAGADHITFHLEAEIHVHRLVSLIRDAGKKAGISIVPSTPVQSLQALLPFLDLILVMTVNPGFGGQKLIPECLDKVRYLDRERAKNGYDYRIMVDGGINRETAAVVREAGTDVLITGSAFFAADDPARELRLIRGED